MNMQNKQLKWPRISWHH